MDKTQDSLAIRLLLEQYAFGMDRRDLGLLRAVFTKDADLSYMGGLQHFVGGDEMVEAMKFMDAAFGPINHSLSSLRIDVTGDNASADFHIIATMLKKDKPVVVVRIVQIADEFVRSGSGWLISKRRHKPMFQYELPSAKIDFPGVGGIAYS